MDVELLRRNGMVPMNTRRAFVDGFTLQIGQRATLLPKAGARSYGMLISLTHSELQQLYSAPGLEQYLPEAVLAQTIEGQIIPALCYNLAEPPNAADRNPEYVSKLKTVLEALGFPAEYVASI